MKGNVPSGHFSDAVEHAIDAAGLVHPLLDALGNDLAFPPVAPSDPDEIVLLEADIVVPKSPEELRGIFGCDLSSLRRLASPKKRVVGAHLVAGLDFLHPPIERAARVAADREVDREEVRRVAETRRSRQIHQALLARFSPVRVPSEFRITRRAAKLRTIPTTGSTSNSG